MQVPDNNPHEVPPRIQGYEILGKLGQGGRSSVWKARQTVLGRMVVIKVLSEQQTHDAEEMRRFKHEALIAASLKHVGIVQVYDFGRLADGIGYYFVMEYVSGYTVGDWLKRKGRLTEAAALTIGSSVADALLYAWSHAMLVHGDLKPDNIMVDGDGTIKITDLGLAQMVNAFVNPARSADAKRPGVGTPNYLAPEQVRGEKNLDCRTDIYGLGTVLYHILTGHLPPSAGIPPGVMDGQIWDSYEDPRKSNSQISSGLAEIIMKMRAQDRAARYQDWKDVMVAIACQEQTAKSGVLVVEPKPSASNDNPSSATIPLRTIAPVTAERKKEPEPEPEEPEDEDEFKPCPYCAEPIRKQAIYCRYCQKDISKKGAAADRARKHPAPGSRPAGAAPPTSSRAGIAPSASPRAGAAPPTSPRPGAALPTAAVMNSPLLAAASAKPRRRIWPHIQMAMSLLLLGAVCYVTYQRFVNQVDVMAPYREKLRAFMQKLQNMAEGTGGSGNNVRRPPEPPPPPLTPVTPVAVALPPAVTNAAVPEYVPTRNETPTNTGLPIDLNEPPPPPLSITEEQRIRQDEVFQQLLRRCEQLQPTVGQEVQLKLKNQKELLTGTLEGCQADRVILRIPNGQVTVPFRIMAEPTRRLFFPEEHALLLYRKQTQP